MSGGMCMTWVRDDGMVYPGVGTGRSSTPNVHPPGYTRYYTTLPHQRLLTRTDADLSLRLTLGMTRRVAILYLRLTLGLRSELLFFNSKINPRDDAQSCLPLS